MLVLMAGLPGTGKSTLARELARATGGHVLNKDVVRDALFGPDAVEYSTPQDDAVMRTMLDAAGYLLRNHPERHVFIDGRVFSRAYQIEEVIAFAELAGAHWCILECVCSEETARRRLERDEEAGAHPASNRDFKLYQEVKARFETITREKTVIDTDQSLETCAANALQAITSRERTGP
jgi:predicted kinase